MGGGDTTATARRLPWTEGCSRWSSEPRQSQACRRKLAPPFSHSPSERRSHAAAAPGAPGAYAHMLGLRSVSIGRQQCARSAAAAGIRRTCGARGHVYPHGAHTPPLVHTPSLAWRPAKMQPRDDGHWRLELVERMVRWSRHLPPSAPTTTARIARQRAPAEASQRSRRLSCGRPSCGRPSCGRLSCGRLSSSLSSRRPLSCGQLSWERAL